MFDTEDDAEAPTAAIEMLLDVPAVISAFEELAVTDTTPPALLVASKLILSPTELPMLIVPDDTPVFVAVVVTDELALAPTPANEMLFPKPAVMVADVPN